MMTSCEHCGHDWHGLACAHRTVVRAAWSMSSQGCECAHSELPEDALTG